MVKNMENNGRFEKQFLNVLTREVLEEAYAKHGNLKAVGKIFGVTGDCIKSYMMYHGLNYNKKIIYICDDSVFSKNDESAFYWAGFMAADGNVSKNKDISISLSSKDINHLEKFKLFLNSDSPITKTIKKTS